MRTLTNLLTAAALAAALSLTACKKKKDEDHDHDHHHGGGGGTPPSSWIEIGHEHDARDQYHVYLYAERNPLIEGYNRFRIQVKRGNGTLYAGNDVRLLPMMYMRDHTHSCPTEQPTGPAQDGFYYGAAFFQMPTYENEPWKMHVLIGSDTVTFNIRVDSHPDGWVKRGMLAGGSDNTRRYIRGMDLSRKATGAQDVTFYVYMRDMMQPHESPTGFPAASHVTKVQVKTWMPSMEHDGGAGSQHATPVEDKPGHYKGKAAFNMTGDWWVIATYMANDTVLGRDTFALNF